MVEKQPAELLRENVISIVNNSIQKLKSESQHNQNDAVKFNHLSEALLSSKQPSEKNILQIDTDKFANFLVEHTLSVMQSLNQKHLYNRICEKAYAFGITSFPEELQMCIATENMERELWLSLTSSPDSDAVVSVYDGFLVDVENVSTESLHFQLANYIKDCRQFGIKSLHIKT